MEVEGTASDTGALRKELFEDALHEVNNQGSRRGKQDVSLEHLFELEGMLLGHSIVQDGPIFPCLMSLTIDCYQ